MTTGQFNFFSFWKQRLVCEPCRARDSTTPGDKTRARSLFTAVISFSLAAVCTLDQRDLQCYHFISICSKTDCFSGQEHASHEYNVAVGPKGEIFSDRACQHNTTQEKMLQITVNLKTEFLVQHSDQWNRGKELRETNSFTSEFLITSAAHVWSSNYLGLPFLSDFCSLVSAYSLLCSPSFNMLIWLTVEQHSSASWAHVRHQSNSAWMWENGQSEMTSCHSISKPCLVSVNISRL